MVALVYLVLSGDIFPHMLTMIWVISTALEDTYIQVIHLKD